jgi:hypothetical protein
MKQLGLGPTLAASRLERPCQTRPVPLFRIGGDVSSANTSAILPALALLADGSVTSTPAGLHIEGVMEDEDARDVNRRLLSAMRCPGRRTRLRAEWTGEGLVRMFFDYVPKPERPASPAG